MVTRGRRKDTDRHQAAKYRNVGSALLQSAKDLEDLATDETRHGNAISVIAIHAAIAYNDAITIAYGGFKSSEGEHVRAPDALLAALKNPSPEAIDLLRAVVKKKDGLLPGSVQYDGRRVRDPSQDGVVLRLGRGSVPAAPARVTGWVARLTAARPSPG